MVSIAALVMLSVYAADFSDSLHLVHEAVNDAEFLAIDAEFSGWFCVIICSLNICCSYCQK